MSVHLEVLQAELDRLDVLIEAEIRRMRARYELSLDEFRGLYISDERVEALLGSGPPTSPPTPSQIAAVRASDASSRWRQLADALGLTEDERDVLVICLAPEIDPKYDAIYAYLNDDVGRRWPTPDLVLRLLGRDAAHRVLLRSLFLPASKLVAWGVIEIAPPVNHEPRIRRILMTAPPLVEWLQGLPYADDRLVGIATPGAHRSLLPDGAIPDEARQAVDGLVREVRVGLGMPPLVLVMSSPGDAGVIAQELFVRAGRTSLVVDLAALRAHPSAADAATAIVLAHRVLGVGIVGTPLDALFEIDGHRADAFLPVVRRLAEGASTICFATGDAIRMHDVPGDLKATVIRLPDLTEPQRAAAWEHALAGGPARDDTLSRTVIDALADRFQLGPDRILKAADAARQAALLDGNSRLSSQHVFGAARAASVAGSNGTTRTVTTAFEWDDLVLPSETKARLTDIVQAVEHRNVVLDQWGLGRRVGGSRGVKVMFAGSSGTGKTMAAAIMAKRLELELHRIELGAVVSKYIGETEKNLDRAFESARRANAVLFIDEADALLGKRSEVKDAHDRYSNVEIAYLLQKMEDHDGVVIVATNLAQNIDESFSRRMQYVVEFPLPDARSRESLWRRMLPEATPVAADVDFAFLGRQFEFAGGDIRNIVLDAAFHAAREGGAIGLPHLLRAVARQYAKDGRVPTEAEFREHYRLLIDGDATLPPASMAPVRSS